MAERCGSSALCLLLTLVAALTGVVQGQVNCFTTDPGIDPNVRCGGPQISATIQDCCLGNGFFFTLTAGDETCNECIVFGWLNESTFEGREQGQSYVLMVGTSKGLTTTPRVFRFTLETTALSTPPPVQNSDFRVSSAATLRPSNTRIEMVQVAFEIDSVALEPRESFRLRLIPQNDASRPQNANEFFLADIELTIIDSDVVVVQFTEADYRANETQLRMPVRVTKNREIATPLVLQVTPMNVSAVIDAGLPLPALELPPVNLLEPNRATSFPEEARDFSTQPVNITFDVDEGNAAPERSIFIPIVNDGVDEASVENFIVLLTLLEANNASAVNVSQPASVCRIVDVDDIRIGFEMEAYTFQEVDRQFDNTIVLIKENNRSTERTFEVVVEVGNTLPSGISANAEFNDDYNIGTQRAQTLRFLPNEQRLRVPIVIISDVSPEGTEAFQLQSRNSDDDPDYDTPPRIAFANTFVVIEDDDDLFVGWERTFTEVSEGVGTFQLRVLIMNLTVDDELSDQLAFFLDLQTVPGTAVSTPGNPTDYVTITVSNNPLDQFNDGTRAQNVSVVITDDLLFEQIESFNLTLTRAVDTPASVIITQDVTVVNILDNDLVRIGFVETAISVSEQGGSIDLQLAVLSGALESPITVELSISDATAVSPEDYMAISPMLLTFNSTTNSTSVTVTIVNNDIFESLETFTASLTLVSPAGNSQISIEPDEATVTIQDDEIVVIGYTSTAISVTEGGTATFSAEVSSGNLGDLAVRVVQSTQDGTATGGVGADYAEGTQSLSFSSQNVTLPLSIETFTDGLTEGAETFTANLGGPITVTVIADGVEAPEAANRVTLNPTVLSITILDIDFAVIGFHPVTYTVQEDMQNINITIEVIQGNLQRAVSVTFFTDDNTAVAPGDYMSVSTDLSFIGTQNQTATVTINSDSLFESDETFFGRLTLLPTQLNVSVAPSQATVTIQDASTVTIGFTSSSYSIEESAGSVTFVVSVLTGTLTREVEVGFSTADGSARAPGDYTALNINLTFDSSTTTHNVTLFVTDDDILEISETFLGRLTLLTTEVSSRVTINPAEATATIGDNDTVVIGYTSTAISVTEGGTATFSAEVSSGNLGDLAVRVVHSTQDGTATGGVGADYAAGAQSLSFSSQNVTIPLSIETFTDGLTEGAETFTANLGGPITVTVIADGVEAPEAANRVTLNPTVLSITILDIDFAVIGFHPVTYTVQEDMQNINITIEVIQGNLQRAVSVTFFTDDNTAVAPGDYMSVSTDLSFIGTQNQTATVTINSDSLFESDETFFGRLTLLPTQLNVSVAPSQATVTIQDASMVTIGFTSSSYSIEESAGNVTFVVSVLTGTLTREVVVGFSTADGTATAPDDYTALSRTLTFDTSTTTREITVSVSDDNFLEIDETFFGRLTLLTTEVSSRVTINPAEATATIGDNDRAVIGFERNFTSVREDIGNTTLRVAVLSGVLQRTVVVAFNTRNGTAEANNDYGPVTNRQLTFDQTTTFVDVQVVIVDDFIVEPAVEAFEGVLTLVTTTADVDILPAVARVEIVDNDNVTIGFTQDAYNVPEGIGFLNVTIEVVGTLGRAVTVSLTTQDGTAVSTGEADFRSTSVDLVFSPTILSRTVMIEIIDDLLLERSEMFTSMLTLTTTDVSIMLAPREASITIIDNDRVIIGFDRPLYTVNETAGSINVGVVLRNGQLRRSVVVTVSTEDGTAQDGLDYSARTQMLTFDQNNVGFNISIPILNNDISEPAEDFFGRLMTDDQDAFLSPNSTRIRIIDDDAVFFTFRQPLYMFLESVGMGEVCIDKVNPTIQTIRIMISGALQPGLGSIDRVLTFLPQDNESCVQFPISNDNIALEEVETLTFTLSIIDVQPGVSLGAFSTARVGILDDDELILTLVKTTDIPENIGTAEACVEFSNQFAQGFQIGVQSMVPSDFNMTGIVAGTPDVDYARVDQTLGVTLADSAAGQRCFTFSVEDDSAVEEPMECLVIRIELPQNASELLRIAPGNESTLCCIQDDDNVTIGFTPAIYQANEGAGTVVLNISVISGILQRAVAVSFTVANGTAFSPGDFIDPVEIVLQFDSIFNSQTATITIVDDNILENDETFLGNLASIDPQVIVAPQTAVVTIVEENDEVTIGFQPDEYTVSESDGSVPLIVVLLEGSLERNVSVEFLTIPGTATSASPADYVRVEVNVEFSPGIVQRSVSVPIVDDSIVEGTELFFAILSDAGDPVVINPEEATIFILDEGDNVTIGFEQTTFTIIEGEVVEVCAAILSGGLERNAIVSISSSDGTAVVPSDYTSVQAEFTFSQTVRQQCVNVTTVNDTNNVEEVEMFVLRLSSADGSVVLNPDTATVSIVDNEVVRVRFEQPQYTFSEGIGQGSVCLRKDLATADVVTVSVFTVDGSALSGDDYVGGSFPVTLGTQANARQCLSITIIADALSEEREDFTVNIQTPTNPQVQTGNPSTATVFIDDLGEEVNDTVIGDPLMTVPILVSEADLAQLGDGRSERVSLCYEIHGRPREYFNFVTDDCASVNAHYVNITRYLNVINRVGIRAVGSGARPQCRNISVDLNGCSAMVDGSPLDPSGRYSFEGIRVRRYPERVRVAVPNCNDLSLVIWIFCQTRDLHDPFNGGTISARMIKIVVMRGLNFGHRNAHGLLGQFWNIPVRVSPFTGVLRRGGSAEGRYTVNLTRPGSTRVASFTGFFYDLTWEFEEGPCLYVGNRQAGPIYEVQDPNDRIIEGSSYKDYIVPGLFSERDYTFGRFNNSLCN